MNEDIKAILSRKKQGTDCTEQESAEIKMFIKENSHSYGGAVLFGVPNDNDLTIDNFPLEYDEALNEWGINDSRPLPRKK